MPAHYMPTRETEWNPGAITAGTPAARNFRTLFPFAEFPFRDQLRVDNRRNASTLTILANGRSLNIAGGDVVTIHGIDFGGPFHGYTLDAASNVTSGTVSVYENGGISEPYNPTRRTA